MNTFLVCSIRKGEREYKANDISELIEKLEKEYGYDLREITNIEVLYPIDDRYIHQ